MPLSRGAIADGIDASGQLLLDLLDVVAARADADAVAQVLDIIPDVPAALGGEIDEAAAGRPECMDRLLIASEFVRG